MEQKSLKVDINLLKLKVWLTWLEVHPGHRGQYSTSDLYRGAVRLACTPPWVVPIEAVALRWLFTGGSFLATSYFQQQSTKA